MNFKKKHIILFLVLICFACQENMQIVIEPQIIPAQNNLNITAGEFYLSSNTNLIYDAELESAAVYWESLSKTVFGSNTGKSNTMRFVLDKSIKNSEAYILDVNTEEITVKASSPKGAFYAIQSLIQLLPPEFIKDGLVHDKNIIH